MVLNKFKKASWGCRLNIDKMGESLHSQTINAVNRI